MNKKKHTRLKSNLATSSILVLCFSIFGCATSKPPVAIPVAPIKRESVVPQLTKVNNGIDSTIKTNIKLEEKLKQQKEEVLKQQLSIAETIALAERLKTKIITHECILELDAINIINGLKSIESRNLFLERQNGELETVRKDQEGILRMTREDASITYRKLMDKENEADSLREQNDYLGKNLKEKNDEAERLKSDLEKNKVALAKANVYKFWVWGLIGGFILWTVVKNIIMIYNPIKFRI